MLQSQERADTEAIHRVIWRNYIEKFGRKNITAESRQSEVWDHAEGVQINEMFGLVNVLNEVFCSDYEQKYQ